MEEQTFFQLIPLRQFDWQVEEESQRVIIKRPKYLSPWAKKFLQPFAGKNFFKIKLDAIGSYIWTYCDGQHTVQEIFETLQQNFPEEANLKQRFAMFLKQLAREKFIVLLQKVDQESSNSHQE